MKVERRLLSLVALLRRAHGPMSRADIVEAMSRMDDTYPFDRPEAARKKLRRDLDLLRELGVVVTWDAVRAGYVLASSARQPVPFVLDQIDADLLVEAVRRLTDAHTGSLRPGAESVLEQAEARELRGHELPLMVHDPDERGDDALFDALVEATWHRRRVRFDYTTLDGHHARRAVEPWGLFRRDRLWHLLGRDEDRDGPRCYRLVALRRLEVVEGDEAFPRPTGPEADVRRWASLHRWQWAMHPPVDVVLACDEVGPLVARTLGGQLDGAHVRLTVTNLDGLDAVLWSWAPRVRPLAPATLVARFRDRIGAIASRHGATP